MGVTIVGPAASTGPRVEPGLIIESRASWSDSWSLELDIEPVRASIQVGSLGAGRCELRHRYGRVKAEGAAAFAARDPKQYVGRWIRLRLGGDQGLQTIWQGRILSEVRGVAGSSWGPTGEQRWIAYDGAHLLDRQVLSTSWWDVGGTVYELEWVPSVNLQKRGSALVGNRNNTQLNGAYVFGKTSGAYQVWSHYDFLQYLLVYYINGVGVSGRPTWTISGETGELEARTTFVPLQPSMSVTEIIRKLISPALGLDWVVVPTEAGYELKVFALSWLSAEFGGHSMPQNPNMVRIEQSTDADVLECVIERSDVQYYDRVRVIGERCKTVVTIPHVAKWMSAQETTYKNGTGTPADLPEEHDAARADDANRSVYQAHGAADTWRPRDANAQPILTSDGSLSSNAGYDQHYVRRTLPKLLLREGWDYTTDPPTEPSYAAGSDIEEDFLPPLVLARLTDAGGYDRYMPCDKLQQAAQDLGLLTPDIGVKALDNEWGVQLSANPNHVLAKNHWSPTVAQTGFLPQSDGGIDYDDLKITIAIEGDYRMELVYALPDALAMNDGSEMVVEVPGAEYWYLAPNTILGVNGDGTLRYSPAAGVELRNDLDKLLQAMAGAIARYCSTRYKGRIAYRRLEAWGPLVGQILVTIETGADVTQGFVGAPICSVDWHFSKRTTEIKTGYGR